MKVLVTGGGGFLGGRIAVKLCARGDEVVVAGRGTYPQLPQSVRQVQADIRDRSALERAFDGVNAVIHAAALPGIWGDEREFYSINVEGTANIIKFCRKLGVKLLVYVSSPSVVYAGRDMINVNEDAPYPERYLCDYAKTKSIAEQMVLASNGLDDMRTMALRPHLIWGPGDRHLIPRIIDRARSGKLVRVGDGRNRVDIIHVDNAAAGHVLALDALAASTACAGKSYFLSDGEPVVLWDWIAKLLRRLGLPPVRRSISYRTGYALGAVLESLYYVCKLSGEPRMTRFLASQLATSHHFDITRAKRDLGYKPVVSPEEGMEQLVAEFRKTVS